MISSVSSLTRIVHEPLCNALGSEYRLLSVELHGHDIHGIVLVPGRALRYVLNSITNEFRYQAFLSLIKISDITVPSRQSVQ